VAAVCDGTRTGSPDTIVGKPAPALFRDAGRPRLVEAASQLVAAIGSNGHRRARQRLDGPSDARSERVATPPICRGATERTATWFSRICGARRQARALYPQWQRDLDLGGWRVQRDRRELALPVKGRPWPVDAWPRWSGRQPTARFRRDEEVDQGVLLRELRNRRVGGGSGIGETAAHSGLEVTPSGRPRTRALFR